jgi:protoporphyrin/coproporphyrin ferrochelatase
MKSRFFGQKAAIHNQVKGNISVKIGVLLVNLGTPAQPTRSALRRYLREFLSDPRVVEIPRFIWLLILHGIILRIRPAKSAKLYQKIWTKQGSPLMVISQAQRQRMTEALATKYGEQVIVDIAMRYGEPSIDNSLKQFQLQGVQQLIVLPLYPQYASPTTGSTFEAVVRELSSWRWIPSLHFINGYHDHPLYIQALANSVNEYIAEHGKPDKLLLSYHGMPKQFLTWGDPYYCFCQKTSRLVTAQLSLTDDDVITSFQSRFGKAQWLTPYTDQVLAELPSQGVKHVAIISPAFSADCLETLEELEHGSRQVFIAAGGETFHYIPALNTRDDHLKALLALIEAQIPK